MADFQKCTSVELASAFVYKKYRLGRHLPANPLKFPPGISKQIVDYVLANFQTSTVLRYQLRLYFILFKKENHEEERRICLRVPRSAANQNSFKTMITSTRDIEQEYALKMEEYQNYHIPKFYKIVLILYGIPMCLEVMVPTVGYLLAGITSRAEFNRLAWSAISHLNRKRANDVSYNNVI